MMIPNTWNIKIMFQTTNQFSRFSQVFPNDSKNSPGFFLDVPISPDVHDFSKFFPTFPDLLITFLGVSQDFLNFFITCKARVSQPVSQHFHHVVSGCSSYVPNLFPRCPSHFPHVFPRFFPQVFLTFSSFSHVFPNLFPRFSLGFPYIFQLFPTFSLHFPPPLAPNRPPTARTLASSANLVKARRLKPPKAPWRCAVSITWGDGEKWWFHGNYHLKK